MKRCGAGIPICNWFLARRRPVLRVRDAGLFLLVIGAYADMMAFPELKQPEWLITPDQLANKLLSKMDHLGKSRIEAGNPEWTRQVKGFLREVAEGLDRLPKDFSIEVLYTDHERDTREFLLDVVWWCRRGAPTEAEFMALAAEVEWASARSGLRGDRLAEHTCARIGEDFSKLIVVKCPIKLMIFCTAKDESEGLHAAMQKKVFSEIDRYLLPYMHHIPGETYVFIDAASNGNRRAWIQHVNHDGVLSVRNMLS